MHVHLEGCLERDGPASFAGLADFLAFLDQACSAVRTREQLAGVAHAFSRRMAASGTGYADCIVNPSHWPAWRGKPGAMIDALDAGFAAAERDGLPPVGLCVSLSRTASAEAATQLVEALVEMRHPRVVALSIDGNEAAAGRTGPRFAAAFRRAGECGLKRTVHAGESSGPEGVRDAIELLGAERIDHGVRAIEEPELVRLLAERQIPLGVCPWSNVSLGFYRSMAEHPLEQLRRAGVRVSVNTDDPALFGTSLEREYARCVEAYGWTADTVREVARTSIEASFAPAATKQRLLAALAAWG